jgi:hypothetical protein
MALAFQNGLSGNKGGEEDQHNARHHPRRETT